MRSVDLEVSMPSLAIHINYQNDTQDSRMDLSKVLNPLDEAPQYRQKEEHTAKRVEWSTTTSNIRLPPMKLSQNELPSKPFSYERNHHQEDHSSPPSYGSLSTPTTPSEREIKRLPSLKMEWEFPTVHRLPKFEVDFKDRVEAWYVQQPEIENSRRGSTDSTNSEVIKIEPSAFPVRVSDHRRQQSMRVESGYRHPLSGYQEHRQLLSPVQLNHGHRLAGYQQQLLRLEQSNKDCVGLAKQEGSRQHYSRRQSQSSSRRHTIPSSRRRISGSWTVSTYHSLDPSCSAPFAQKHPDTKKPKGSHSNEAYTLEQVDAIRYFKDDLHLEWPAIQRAFEALFPGARGSQACLHSRYYRDNTVPLLSPSGKPLFDKKGKLRVRSAKVRGRATPEGREDGVPFGLVEKAPWRAVTYSWVREADRERARRIENGDDPSDDTGRKAYWRKILKETDEYRYAVIFEKKQQDGKRRSSLAALSSEDDESMKTTLAERCKPEERDLMGI